METPIDKYIREHSTAQTEALAWIQKQTNIKTNYPRMLSGAVQGRFLTILVEIMQAEKILEIGTFTGYSSVCMAMGLNEKGHIDTLEINDEAGVTDKITLHIGDALQTLNTLKGNTYDLAYIDANKRQYVDYYNTVIDLVRPGGVILTDDVLWDGKVCEIPMPQDKQTIGIAAFNDLVASDTRVEAVILPIRDGLTLIRKK